MALDGGGWSTPRSGRFTDGNDGKKERKLSKTQDRFGRVRKIYRNSIPGPSNLLRVTIPTTLSRLLIIFIVCIINKWLGIVAFCRERDSWPLFTPGCRKVTWIIAHILLLTLPLYHRQMALQLAMVILDDLCSRSSVVFAREWFVSWRGAKCYEGLWKNVGIVLLRFGTSCYLCLGDGKCRLRSMMSSSRSNENNPSTIMNTKEKEKYIEEFDFLYCDEATKYEKVAKIGQGTFG